MAARESDHQKTYFDWIEKVVIPKFPPAHFIFATLNGAWIAGKGKSKFALINSYKRQGLKNGVPDIWIPIPIPTYQGAGHFHFAPGAVIELKVGKNKPTDEQKEWINSLQEMGWYAAIAYGFEEAKQHTVTYLELDKYGIE